MAWPYWTNRDEQRTQPKCKLVDIVTRSGATAGYKGHHNLEMDDIWELLCTKCLQATIYGTNKKTQHAARVESHN